MSTKGTFTIIVNSGKQDKILQANELLSKRLNDIKNEKIQVKLNELNGYLNRNVNDLSNVQGEIDYIRSNNGYSKTDLLTIDPADPSAKNYLKLAKTQNYLNLIQKRTMLINEKAEIMKDIKNQKNANDESVQPSLTDIEKTHLNILTKKFKPFIATGFEYITSDSQGINYMNGFGNELKFTVKNIGDFTHDQFLHIRLEGLEALAADDKVRYCNFLGHRIIDTIRFNVNGVDLDKYTGERYNTYYNFELPSHKKNGYLANIGQSVPQYGYMTSDPLTEDFSEVRWIIDGPQTLKKKHGVVDLFIPLLFWYNRDIGLSLPSIAIPGGQTDIYVKLNSIEKICTSVYVGPLTNVKESNFTPPKITIARLYSNQIYVNPEVHDIVMNKSSFTLIRVHKQLLKILNKPKDDIQLLEIKWPVEHMYFCARPTENEDGIYQMDLWHRTGSMTVNDRATAGVVYDTLVSKYTPAASFIRQYSERPSVDNITVKAQGIILYDNYPSQIFNSYFPYKFGNINTPEELGYYLINFNFTPTAYQPTGYFNMSTAREFFISYSSNVFSTTNTGRLHLTAMCLNFLIVKDGGANLHYST